MLGVGYPRVKLSSGVGYLGVGYSGGRVSGDGYTPPGTTEADGTHHTGMLSCYENALSSVV